MMIMGSEEASRRTCLHWRYGCRVSKGFHLKRYNSEKLGLLYDMTCIFRENGLSITREEVTTQGDKVVNVLYVIDTSRNPIDVNIAEFMRR
jgi:UTP:GlnB (protein PII) uridylyltransferase